jgi:hypothetical protein
MEQNNMTMMDISPESLMVDPKGNVEVGDYYMLKEGQTGYHRLLLNKTQSCYLCPQLFAQLAEGREKCVCNCYVSDVYSLGMTLLELATLANVQSCYNF